MKHLDLSLILPCFNETVVFTQSVQQIEAVLALSRLTYEIIIVDDGSSDGTVGLIKQSHHRAIFHSHNQGRGKSVSDGIRAARGTVVGYMDIDCEVSPIYIPEIVRQIIDKETDVVIGKRYYRSSFRALVREILSRGYMWLSNCMVGTGYLDTETGYKFFNRTKIIPIVKQTTNSGWFWDTEIMVRAREANLRIREEPVLFLRRFDKHSSVHIGWDTLEYIKNLWNFRRRLRVKQIHEL
jgi:glycosyltransferase AglD